MASLTSQGGPDDPHTIVQIQLTAPEVRRMLTSAGLLLKYDSSERSAGKTTIFWKESVSTVELERLATAIAAHDE